MLYHSSKKKNHVKNKPLKSRKVLLGKASTKFLWEEEDTEIFWNGLGEELIQLANILDQEMNPISSSA